MKILVVDGQGGKLGKQLVEKIIFSFPKADLTAVGTNSTATAAMIKGGAVKAATGENALIVAARKSDVIIGPIGIVVADSLLGEISPKMAVAVGSSDAIKILLPVNKCDNFVVGTGEKTINEMTDEVVQKLKELFLSC